MDTRLLLDIRSGNTDRLNELMPHVYKEVRRIAQHQLSGERPNHTINPTALAHEAYIKLVHQNKVNWQNRAHFFALAARAMRQILVDYSRAQKADKRGGNKISITLNEMDIVQETRFEELIILDEALSQLKELNERQALVVEYWFFGGLKHEEIAGILNISLPSVRRDWRLARAWLSKQLKANN